MKKGERAVFVCQPAFAYGTEGAMEREKEIEKIPPSAVPHFDVELISFEGDGTPPKDPVSGQQWPVRPPEGSLLRDREWLQQRIPGIDANGRFKGAAEAKMGPDGASKVEL